MNDIDVLIEKVQDELGMEVYYIYPNERHFFGEEILIGLVISCLWDYLKPFIRPEKIGEAHRSKLVEFVSKVRGGQFSQKQDELEHLKADVNQLLREAAKNYTQERTQQAIQELQASLNAIGFPEARAEEHARQIANLAAEHIQTNHSM